jgi:hypothetical protein
MKKYLLLLFVIVFCHAVTKAQSTIEKKQPVMKVSGGSALTAQLTLSEGFSLAKANAGYHPYYLHGSASCGIWYMSGYRNFNMRYFSLSGDVYAQIGSKLITTNSSRMPLINQQYNLFFGGDYHWQKGMNDISFGMAPGLGLSKLINASDKEYVFSPLMSGVINYNLWMSSYFRFFAQGRLVVGTHMSTAAVSLTETRVSAGLAFALPLHLKIGAH